MNEIGLLSTTKESISLTGVAVTGDLSSGHACVRVKQTYRNTGAGPIEAIYTFPLPTEAVLSGFTMTCAGRTQTGFVKEREEAFRAYDDALVGGHGAALVEEERPNVFTASVGNVLPGEEVAIELEYIERLFAEEGAVRFTLPTLVAPRYIPGIAHGDRTANGTQDPTTRVPDADRISPPTARDVPYRMSLTLAIDVGKGVTVESPSHVIKKRTEQGKDGSKQEKTVVTFESEPLDRDFVLLVSGAATGDSVTVSAHRRAGDEQGYVALTVVPDLFDVKDKSPPLACVFLLDRSGSMGGASMTQARTALRLCLRQLKKGDLFNIIAFDDMMETMSISPVPFTGRTLADADEFLARIDARGGTELLGPLLHAVGMVKDGLVVLVTDGQVGNEDEILTRVMEARKGTRISSFGIGTNVSTALLSNLAKSTNGALDMIYPGERIDEKVAVAFARATAARITDVSVTFEGVFLGDIAPNPPRDLTDGEPWTLFGTFDEPGVGRAIIRGKRAGEAFALTVPLWLPEDANEPFVERLWAKERIKELERADLTGRRADAMKARIVELCVKHRIASKHASFIVIEKRKGERRTSEQAETQVVPVNLPAGWTMFQPGVRRSGQVMMSKALTGGAPAQQSAMSASGPMGSAGGHLPSPRRPMGMPASFDAPPPPAPGGRPAPAPAARASVSEAVVLRRPEAPVDDESARSFSPHMESLYERAAPPRTTSPASVFETQGASGLWGDEQDLESACAATVRTLAALLAEGMDASHSVYGAQIRKAIDALVGYAPGLSSDAIRVRLLVLAWLMSGRRTRAHVAEEASTTGAAPHLVTEDAARTFLAAHPV